MNWSVFWSAASAIAGIGVLIATVVYAWLTHRLAKIAESQAWHSSRARVIASIGTNQGGMLLLLEVQNFGPSVAEDVRVSLSCPVFQLYGTHRPIAEMPLFRQGVRSLPPNKPIRYSLGVSSSWLNEETDREKHPNSFDVTVSYRTLGKYVEEIYCLDIERQYSQSLIMRDYSEEFSRSFPAKFDQSMQKVEKSIGKLAPRDAGPRIVRRAWSSWFSASVSQRRRLLRH